MAESVLRRTQGAIGVLNDLNVRSFFETLWAAKWVSQTFHLCSYRVLLVTSLCDRSNISCPKTLFATERLPLWALWYDVRRMSYNGSLIKLSELLGYQLVHLGLYLFADASGFRAVFNVPTRILGNVLPLRQGTVPSAIVAFCLKMTFHEGSGMSFCVSSTSIYKDSSFVAVCNAAPRFSIDI